MVPHSRIQTVEKGFAVSLILYAAALPVSMSVTNIALGILLFFSAILFWFRRDSGWPLPISIWFILAFFLWAAVTKWISSGSFAWGAFGSFSKIWNFLPYLIIPVGVGLGLAHLERALKVLVTVASIVVLLGAVQYWTGIHYFFEGWFGSDALVIHRRFYGFQSHPLHSGGLYTIACLTAAGLALFYSTRRERTFWAVNALVLALGVVLTGSRSYYLGLAAGVTILLAFRGWKFLLAGFLAGSVALGSIMVLDSNLRQRIMSLDARRTDQSARLRVYMWKTALLMARDHPWTGVGYKNWKKEVPNYAHLFPEWTMDKAAFAHAHNSYLTVLSETGAIGIVLFLSFWIVLVREQMSLLFSAASETFPHALAMVSIAALVSLFVAGFFEHNLLTATISLSLFYAIGLSRAVQSA